MEYFDCHGWLHIRFCEGENVAHVKIVHTEAHVHYCKIDVPEDVKKFVEQHADLKTDEVSSASSERAMSCVNESTSYGIKF